MSNTVACVIIGFDSGHRVWKHEGRCNFIHGHRYTAEIRVERRALDSLGRVIDFGVVKEEMKTWIDTYWDHQTILHQDDPLGPVLEAASQKVFYLNENPTAENMARELYNVAESLLGDRVSINSVRLYETPNCYAEYPSSKVKA